MVCTTVSPNFAKEMALISEDNGLLYLDAPISGGSLKSSELPWSIGDFWK